MQTLKIISIYVAGVFSLFVLYIFCKVDTTTDNRIRPKPAYTQEEYPTYYEEDLESEWPFNLQKTYNDSHVYRWSELTKVVTGQVQGVGEGGSAFIPRDDQKELMDQLFKQENFNLLASDMISLHRSLPDSRPKKCKKLSYPEKLPNTSVIIVFHNEAWTNILRTVWSVVDRSPHELLHEVILVDDASTLPCLKRPLDDYIERIPVSVKLIRTSKREGLIRARLIGARQAKGSVLTFFDAHVECIEGWLHPLLARIASDRSVVASPAVDGISSRDMGYYRASKSIHGFRSSLIFTWMPVPERELVRTHHSATAPLRTPTFVGCAFAIDREFFFEIGSYDEGMDIWGSENMELSLRVWQCGGSLEIIPCSHVGHLFRVSTYSFDGNSVKIKARNNVRLVEVWMKEVKRVYYVANPYSQNVSSGDLTDRIELKNRLKCKDFRWYLDNVYPECLFRKEFTDFVQIKNVQQNKCIDTNPGFVDTPVALYACHGHRGNQLLLLTKDQMIVTMKFFCIGVDQNGIAKTVSCEYQDKDWWKYDNETKWFVHNQSGKCMQATEDNVILGDCDSASDSFKWEIESTP